jgi:hypothetical protein
MIQEHQMTMNILLVTFFGRKVIRHTIITGIIEHKKDDDIFQWKSHRCWFETGTQMWTG